MSPVPACMCEHCGLRWPCIPANGSCGFETSGSSEPGMCTAAPFSQTAWFSCRRPVHSVPLSRRHPTFSSSASLSWVLEMEQQSNYRLRLSTSYTRDTHRSSSLHLSFQGPEDASDVMEVAGTLPIEPCGAWQRVSEYVDNIPTLDS